MFQNIPALEKLDCENVLILSGDHVYRMDYGDFIAFHEGSGNPASVGVVSVPKGMTSEFGIATVDAHGAITKFEEKPKESSGTLASMGIYLFDREYLISLLKSLEQYHGNLDFGKHVITHLVSRRAISAYRFPGYWLDIGTLKSYYKASLELLVEKPRLTLYSWSSPVLTVPDDAPPLVVTSEASISNSLVCNGCIVAGSVRSSILSPNVRIGRGATVEGSILFNDCVVEPGARVRNAIMDKGVAVGPRAVVGFGNGAVANELQPGYLDFGVTIIGKRTAIPGGVTIGTNCLVSGTLDRGLIPKRNLPDGASFIAEETRP